MRGFKGRRRTQSADDKGDGCGSGRRDRMVARDLKKNARLSRNETDLQGDSGSVENFVINDDSLRETRIYFMLYMIDDVIALTCL